MRFKPAEGLAPEWQVTHVVATEVTVENAGDVEPALHVTVQVVDVKGAAYFSAWVLFIGGGLI